MIYKDGDKNFYYLKRFAVSGVTRDKSYSLSSSKNESNVAYFSANPNGEAEIVSILLRQSSKLKKIKWDLDFSDYLIKGRSSKGNVVTKHSVNKIELKEKGVSTLKPRKIWFDDAVQRLNVDARGELLGEFSGEDKLLVVRQNGILKTISPEITTHFTEDMIVLEKWVPKKPISAVYFDGVKEKYFLKRFLIENENKEELFISENKNSFLELISTDWKPVIELVYNKERNKDKKENNNINIDEFISVKGIKAQGNQLTSSKIKQINLLDSIEYTPPVELSANEIEVVDVSEVNEEKEDHDDTDLDKGQITLF
jgi:topoisomerase-4 subunit A